MRSNAVWLSWGFLRNATSPDTLSGMIFSAVNGEEEKCRQVASDPIIQIQTQYVE